MNNPIHIYPIYRFGTPFNDWRDNAVGRAFVYLRKSSPNRDAWLAVLLGEVVVLDSKK